MVLGAPACQLDPRAHLPLNSPTQHSTAERLTCSWADSALSNHSVLVRDRSCKTREGCFVPIDAISKTKTIPSSSDFRDPRFSNRIVLKYNYQLSLRRPELQLQLNLPSVGKLVTSLRPLSVSSRFIPWCCAPNHQCHSPPSPPHTLTPVHTGHPNPVSRTVHPLFVYGNLYYYYILRTSTQVNFILIFYFISQG